MDFDIAKKLVLTRQKHEITVREIIHGTNFLFKGKEAQTNKHKVYEDIAGQIVSLEEDDFIFKRQGRIQDFCQGGRDEELARSASYYCRAKREEIF